MVEITVELGARRYPVSIGHGLTRSLPELLAQFQGRRIVLVASRKVFALYRTQVQRPLARLGSLTTVIVPDGERYKSRASLERLHDEFLKAGLARDGLVVALGGGVVGDLCGYAAATYMRGVDWLGLPTTLLSMVDSSVGGKVGINHPLAKNLIGAFHQPRAVVVDTAFLDSLPARQLQSGAYEVAKCAVLADRALFSALQEAPPGLRGWDEMQVENAIASSCRIKAEVVARDEREGNLRRVLNLGHTLGHAFEAQTRYRRFTHGEAVGWGLIGAAHISASRGLLPAATYDAILSVVDNLGPRPAIGDLPASGLLAALKRDKKTHAGRVPFILPTAIGRVSIQNDVEEREIRLTLKALAKLGPRRPKSIRASS